MVVVVVVDDDDDDDDDGSRKAECGPYSCGALEDYEM